METNTPPLLQWNTPVRPHVERGHTWYVVAGTIVLAVAAYGILTGSWPLAVVSVLAGAMYFFMRDHKSRETAVGLYEAGVLYDEQFRRWEEFLGFWVLQTKTHAELHLSYRAKYKNDLVIQMGNLSADDIKLACGSFLTELIDKKESLIDTFTRIAKL